MSFAIFLIISVILAIIQTAVPFLVKRSVVFGVTIPESYIQDIQLKAYKKIYAVMTAVLSLLLLGFYSAWVLLNHPGEEKIVLTGCLIEFSIILISMSLYFYFHGETIQLKKTQKFTDHLKQVKIMDLTVRSQDEMLPSFVYLLPVLIAIGLIGYTALHYQVLPEQIPTHWGPSGKADAFTAKSPFSAVSMMLILLVMQFMFLGIHSGTKSSGIKLSAAATEASRLRQLTLRKYSSWFMFLVSLLLTIMMSFFQLTIIHPAVFSNSVMFIVPLVFLIVVLAGTIFFALKVGRTDKQIHDQRKEKIADLDEDSYWKGGLIYFNKNDPSIFVEKRFGVGWTLNFANPMGYFIVFVPLIGILLIAFWL
nr:DUF5808 domain-containing protein [uncultured Bacillus sp.]